MSEIAYNPDWPEWFDGKHINEVLFSEEFLAQHPMKCINGHLFTVDGPIESEELVKKQILDMVQSCVTTSLSKRAGNLLEVIKLRSFSEPLPMETDRIHVANGIYYLDGHFEATKVYCNNRLKVSYNPEAPEPVRWLTFLSELLEPDDILTLQEYLGYCLIPSTKGQKMMMILGKGGEGKSRIGLILNAMMGGSMNVSSIQKIETNRFARADLEHRLLMVDDDMDLNALPKTNYIKSIVTAEAKMDLERKGIQSYQNQLFARFLCFGNGALTSLYDHSDGFYRRQLILTTKDRPPGRKDDPFLVEKLTGELEGIFLWCLEGLHRLIVNGYQFTVSSRTAENVETIKRSNNNILEFLASTGYIRFKADAEASSKAIYEAYKQFCEDNAYHCLSANRLSSELAQNERKYNVEATNNIYLTGGKRVRGFMGIRGAGEAVFLRMDFRKSCTVYGTYGDLKVGSCVFSGMFRNDPKIRSSKSRVVEIGKKFPDSRMDFTESRCSES